MAVLGDSLYVYGGRFFNGSMTNEIWAFNISTQAWTQLSSALCVMQCTDSSAVLLNDTACYSQDSMEVARAVANCSAAMPPIMGATVTVVDDVLVVMGGVSDTDGWLPQVRVRVGA